MTLRYTVFFRSDLKVALVDGDDEPTGSPFLFSSIVL